MRRISTIAALWIAAALVAGTEVAAQETAAAMNVPSQEVEAAEAWEGELRAMVSQPTAADRDRRDIGAFLEREEVREVAERHGLSLDDMRAGVATLSGDEAAGLAERVREADDDMPQTGDRFVISSTAIIIALLVVILVLVA